jgi:hypothetical protein
MIDPLTGLDLTKRERVILENVLAGGPNRPLNRKEIAKAVIGIALFLIVVFLYITESIDEFRSSIWFDLFMVIVPIVVIVFSFRNANQGNYETLIQKCYTRMLELQGSSHDP